MLNETFGGAALPPGWTATPPPTSVIVSDDTLKVDAGRVESVASTGPGSSLAFTATFGAQANQHIGFGTTFDSGTPWAIFSTSGSSSKIFARTSNGTSPIPLDGHHVSTDITDIDPGIRVSPGVEYDFRIEWSATDVKYYVDDHLLATHAVVVSPSAIKAAASDFNSLTAPAGIPVTVNSMLLRTARPGTFTSKIFDAGDSRASGIAFTHGEDTPTGTGVAYETQTSADGDDLDRVGPCERHQAGALLPIPRESEHD